MAAGFSLNEADAEARKVLPEAVDTGDFGPALEHPDSRRRVQLHAPGTPLDEALRGSLEAWRVYLHPDQEQLVRMQARGPVKVLGGAGTGKTVALMHRAAWLATEVFTAPRDRLFVTTFTRNLAVELRRNIRKLLSPAAFDRIEVQNMHAFAVSLVKRAGQPVDVVDAEQQARLWQWTLADVDHGLPVGFFKDEWRDVVQAQRVRTERDYLLADRVGRGTPLTRRQRRALWPVFE